MGVGGFFYCVVEQKRSVYVIFKHWLCKRKLYYIWDMYYISNCMVGIYIYTTCDKRVYYCSRQKVVLKKKNTFKSWMLSRAVIFSEIDKLRMETNRYDYEFSNGYNISSLNRLNYPTNV